MKPSMLLGAFAMVAALSIHGATLPYQGLATDAKGNAKSDAAYKAVFSLYSVSSGGTALWSETQNVTTTKGLFSTSLGSVSAIPDSLFTGSPLYLGVIFDGGTEGRSLLGTVPWATRSGTSVKAGYSDTSRASHLADSAKVVVGFSDSLTSIRSALASQLASVTATMNAKRSIDSTLIANQAVMINKQENSLVSLMALLNPTVAWQSSVTYGSLVDSRDGQVYRTVQIGTQTWMAQNLNYAVDSSWCPGGVANNCAIYGRLYRWSEVMAGSSSSASIPSGVQGICPSGWHVPSDAEWTKLTDTTLSSSTAGTVLQSTSGWSTTNTGTDVYGFRVLPAGSRSFGGTFDDLGHIGIFWSSSEYDASNAWYRNFYHSSAHVYREDGNKSLGFSLRCVQN